MTPPKGQNPEIRPESTGDNREKGRMVALEAPLLNISRATNILGDDVAGGLVEKVPKNEKLVFQKRIMAEMSINSLDFAANVKNIRSRPFSHFAKEIGFQYNVPVDKLLADADFKKAFIELRDFEMNREKRQKEKQKYFSLKEKVIHIIAGYVGEKPEAIRDFFDEYMHVMGDVEYKEIVSKKATDPKVQAISGEVYKKYFAEQKENDEKFEKGQITVEEHNKKNEELNEEVAKNSGDKDVQKAHKKYKENMSYVPSANETKLVVLPVLSSDKPVTNKDQVQQALATVNSDSFHMDLHEDGASVIVGPEKYPMEVHVYKNDQTNQYVYFVADHYADNGCVRVDSGNLSEALDGRYLDSYISEKVGIVSDDNDSPNKIPDAMMVRFGEKLLGNGKARGYKIEGENREVLNAMIKVLEQPSEKYPNYYKKIEALNIFFEKEENIAGLRRRLLAGEKPSLDDLIRG